MLIYDSLYFIIDIGGDYMNFSYNKLYDLMDRKGYSFRKLKELGVVTDHSSRLINNGKSVQLEHLASICVFFEVDIEDVVEIILPNKVEY